MSSKRIRDVDAGNSKRSRVEVIARLCDLRSGMDVFRNKMNATRAREKGYLRSREASGKYEELEKKLFSLFAESGELEFPNEEWVFDVLPELNDLEPETLDVLLTQAQTHAKYEAAARELVMLERFKLDEDHEAQLRALRSQLESEAARKSVSDEMRLKQTEVESKEEVEALRAEAQERIKELEETVEELEGTIAEQQQKMKEMEDEADAECERLREEGLNVCRRLQAAQEETDLKRETQRKLKEEIIDNDRLTVANLNRIKHLEALVEQHKQALEEAEAENTELREELTKSVDPKEVEHEVATLRELLDEREHQLMVMSRRLSEVLEEERENRDGGEYGGGHGLASRYNAGVGDGSSLGMVSRAPGRRDSFLERFGLGQKSLLASSA